MDERTYEVVTQGIRWVSTILVDLNANYGRFIGVPANEALRLAIRSLQAALDAMRDEMQDAE